MSEYVFHDLRSFGQAFKRDQKARERRARKTLKVAARFARKYVRDNTIPIAFRELVNSLHVVDVSVKCSEVIADAPHAGAVENGSRPHMPPLAPLIAWVKLRGMQGLTDTGRVIQTRSVRTDWRKGPARAVALALKGKVRGRGDGRLRTSVDAAEQIARAIQFAISKRGTKPFKFMFQAIEPTIAHLGELVPKALQDVSGADVT